MLEGWNCPGFIGSEEEILFCEARALSSCCGSTPGLAVVGTVFFIPAILDRNGEVWKKKGREQLSKLPAMTARPSENHNQLPGFYCPAVAGLQVVFIKYLFLLFCWFLRCGFLRGRFLLGCHQCPPFLVEGLKVRFKPMVNLAT
jgi:hypothetical protein